MPSAPELEQHVTELQTQLAFQEDTIQTLNDIVTRQQAQIDKLEHEVKALLVQMQQLSDALRPSPADEAPPPHY
ncbi:MAG: SlyX family protein [Gammaproteobacteria bacterium]|jgi:SlyX protein